jgi:fructoselysine/glucoselysine PTS system EIIB component
MIKLLRVDDRLIHGQVAMVWTSFLQANHIIVANDKVANDAMSKMALSLAKPPGVDLEFLSVNSAIEHLNGTTLANKKVFVVVESTSDARTLCSKVGEISKVIFGGIRQSGGKTLIDRQVFLDAQDIQNWKDMVSMGKEVQIQVVPSEKTVNLSEAERIFNKGK